MTDHRPPITVRKYGVYVPISCCIAGSCAPGDHPAPPPLPWLKRARWRLASWWFAYRPHAHFGPCRNDEESW